MNEENKVELPSSFARIAIRSRHPEMLAEGVSEIAAYLPANYKVISVAIGDDPDAFAKATAEEVLNELLHKDMQEDFYVYIAGIPSHGWTLDNYVIPRLASGMIGCSEVEMGDLPKFRKVSDILPQSPAEKVEDLLVALKTMIMDLVNNGEVFNTDQKRIDYMQAAVDKAEAS